MRKSIGALLVAGVIVTGDIWIGDVVLDDRNLAGLALRPNPLNVKNAGAVDARRAVAATASSSALPFPTLRGLLRDDERAAQDR